MSTGHICDILTADFMKTTSDILEKTKMVRNIFWKTFFMKNGHDAYIVIWDWILCGTVGWNELTRLFKCGIFTLYCNFLCKYIISSATVVNFLPKYTSSLNCQEFNEEITTTLKSVC